MLVCSQKLSSNQGRSLKELADYYVETRASGPFHQPVSWIQIKQNQEANVKEALRPQQGQKPEESFYHS